MPDAWENVVYPGMKNAVINSLLCCQDNVEQRKVILQIPIWGRIVCAVIGVASYGALGHVQGWKMALKKT